MHDISRRQVLKSGIGLAGILATGRCPAYIKSLIGATNTGLFKDAPIPSASEYIQDGLLSMWDGIENVDWDTHDAKAAKWYDLVGGINLNLNTHSTWKKNGLSITSRQPAGLAYLSNPYASATIKTIEGCFDLTLDTENGQGRGLVCVGNSRSVMGAGLKSVRSRGEPSVQTLRVTNRLVSAFSTSVVYAQSVSNDLIYFNGESQSSETASGNWGLMNNIYIGGGSMGQSGVSIIGTCHCARVYSRALTAEEVLHNYLLDKARFGL